MTPSPLRPQALAEFNTLSTEAAEAAWLGLVSANAAASRRLNGLLEGQGGLPLNHLPGPPRLSRARNGEMRRVDLAHALLLTPSGVTRLLTHLEHDGHVAQGKSDKAGRVRSALITEKGRARLAQATPLHTAAIQALFGQRYSDEELAILSDLLARLDVVSGDRSFSG